VRKNGDMPPRAAELLAAALELFSKREFSAVTIKEIGKSIGVNTALIYYYFDSKEELFRASLKYAIEEALANYQRLRERHTDPVDPVDLITDWFDTNVQSAKPIQQLIKIMLDYSTSRKQKTVVDEIIKQFYEVECGILSSGIRQGIKSGIFRQVDPDKAAQIVSTYLDGVIVRSLIHKDLNIRTVMRDLKRLFWDYLGQPREVVMNTRSSIPQRRSSRSLSRRI
jgi:AcrR family transcriptional regulator